MCTTRSAVFVVAAVLAGSASAFAGDYIQRKDGSFSPAFKGTRPETQADFDLSDWQVLDADLTSILYTIPVGGKAQTQKMAASEVMDIHLEPRDFPQLWREAAAALQTGDWNNAGAKFRTIGDDKTGKINPIVRQQALLRAARAAAGPGDKKAVAAADLAYEHLLKTFPNTFYTRAVWKDRWVMFIDASMEDKAKEAIDQLLKLAGVTDADKLEARFASTTINLRKATAAKDTAGVQKAHDEYKALAADTAGKKELSSVNALASMGMGTCLLELGNAGQAKGIFAEMCQREEFDSSVMAAAFNGLGECWYRENNPKGYTEALRCFLRTQLLYADGAPADTVAKAICYTGECFSRLGDSTRARQELSSCMQRFPNSPWADRASKLRAGLK
jgi:hypothetical protein